MARQKPYTAKQAQPAADPAAAGPTCSGCRHWRDQAPELPDEPTRLGLCVVEPPSVHKEATVFGPLCAYRVTRGSLTACGKFEAK